MPVYAVDDVVFYDGSSYVCVMSNQAQVPLNNLLFWNLLAQSGFPHRPVRTIVALNDVVLPTDYFLIVDATANNVNVTVPPASEVPTKTPQLKFRRIDATLNTVTLIRQGADTFNEASTLTITISGAGTTVELDSDGASKWFSS